MSVDSDGANDEGIIFSAESGRVVYVDHSTQTTGWVPDRERWNCLFGLPYDGRSPLTLTDNSTSSTTLNKEQRIWIPEWHDHRRWPARVNRIHSPRVSRSRVLLKAFNHSNLQQAEQILKQEDSIDSIGCFEDTDVETTRPEPRQVEIRRHPQLGFGFVAGSERPVIIRFVTDGGPSTSALLPCDEILAVNEEDVSSASKDRVVTLIRRCSSVVRLTVCQPRRSSLVGGGGDDGGLDDRQRSSLLTAHKRARLRQRPSRVRFAEGVFITPTTDTADADVPDGSDSCVTFMPNVMRVFLENGQTRSFKYDSSTTVQDVIESLGEKLAVRNTAHFSLCLEHPQGPRSNKLTLLNYNELLVKIASRPGSQHFRCLFRLTFVPNVPVELYRQDPIAFEYYYRQCVNDVVAGRFAYEMRYEACIRLAALHIQQIAVDTNVGIIGTAKKISLKLIEKEYGLGTFLPAILLENVKTKEIRKHVRFYLKRDSLSRHASSSVTAPPTFGNGALSATAPTIDDRCALARDDTGGLVLADGTIGPALTTSTELKLKYIDVLAQMPTYGGRSFAVAFLETKTDMILEVHPRQGVEIKHPGRLNDPAVLIGFDLISDLAAEPEGDVLAVLSIGLKNDTSQALKFLVEKDDLNDLVLFIKGYCYQQLNEELKCNIANMRPADSIDDMASYEQVPPYRGVHNVRSAGWNYVELPSADRDAERDAAAEAEKAAVDEEGRRQRLVDFSRGPPTYRRVVVASVSAAPSSPSEATPSSTTSAATGGDSERTTIDEQDGTSSSQARTTAQQTSVDNQVMSDKKVQLQTEQAAPELEPSSQVDAGGDTPTVRTRTIRFRDDLLVSHSPTPDKQAPSTTDDDAGRDSHGTVPPTHVEAVEVESNDTFAVESLDTKVVSTSSISAVKKQVRLSTDSASSLEEYTPKTFLKAKDSFVIRSVSDKPTKFLKARDSMLMKNVGREGFTVTHKLSEEKQIDETAGDEEWTATPRLSRGGHFGEVSSSDDTGSGVSSPSQSPIHLDLSAKLRPQRLVATPTEFPTEAPNASFGLKSPADLPLSNVSEKDLQEIIHSCQLEGPALEDLLLLFPDNFCTDANIIDLTGLPSPSEEFTDDSEREQSGAKSIRPPPPPTRFRDSPTTVAAERVQSSTDRDIMNRLTRGDFTVIEQGGALHSESPPSHGGPFRRSGDASVGGVAFAEERLMLRGNNGSSASTAPTGSGTERRRLSAFRTASQAGPPAAATVTSAAKGRRATLDNLRHERLDEFIAKTVIPPPPPSTDDASVGGGLRQKSVRFAAELRGIDGSGSETSQALTTTTQAAAASTMTSSSGVAPTRRHSEDLIGLRQQQSADQHRLFSVSPRKDDADQQQQRTLRVSSPERRQLLEDMRYAKAATTSGGGKRHSVADVYRTQQVCTQLSTASTMTPQASAHQHRLFSVSPRKDDADHHHQQQRTLRVSSPERLQLLEDMRYAKAATTSGGGKRHSVADVYRTQQLLPRRRRRSLSTNTIFDMFTTQQKHPPSSLYETVRRVSLKDYSGLEEVGEEETAESNRLTTLNQFGGLEVLERGVASIELKRNPQRSKGVSEQGADSKKFYARVRSVDPLLDVEHSVSPQKQHKNSGGSTPPSHLNAIIEAVTPSEGPDTTAAHHQLLLSNVGGQAAETTNSGGIKEYLSGGARRSLIDVFSSHRTHHNDKTWSPSSSTTTPPVNSAAATSTTPKTVGNGCLTTTATGGVDVDDAAIDVDAAKRTIDELLLRLKTTAERLPSRSPRRNTSEAAASQAAALDELKRALLSDAQQLSSATVRLVRASGGGGTAAPLAACLREAVRVTTAAEALLQQNGSLFKNQVLAAKVREVLDSLRGALDALQSARGKALGDADTKRFVRHSTTLAATLTQLIQAVKDV